uniref:Bromodomain associated domain-containing protein n=1 Tax=Chromera velia CCMP2878 TaxID=1169474 RepID=A0A0G4I450_9ALVE|mmetsp:Transcript_53148/g.104032  ORF Transcript_53148/g.104032 Transcript_53148/m.104032 type:complete len:332 (-) Transcript_53148:319-1314(-)|eukprot:Cvel_10828.t1-p1 / transcript=Cvel_10828.t1 / gene=Cvel_10828 / organism=Chromera_velia_CCMP2878 / gene_product=hypothetical protein / transcript_product=hypothetical protein / location=Cvel_scaffold662:58345-61305(+) / protein_length=331 / sequence_SO=supercontig / SO=protein_coding / is_pseudo=false
MGDPREDMTPSERHAALLLHETIARVLKSHGLRKIDARAFDMIADVAGRFVQRLGEDIQYCAEIEGRSVVNMYDVQLALSNLQRPSPPELVARIQKRAEDEKTVPGSTGDVKAFPNRDASDNIRPCSHEALQREALTERLQERLKEGESGLKAVAEFAESRGRKMVPYPGQVDTEASLRFDATGGTGTGRAERTAAAASSRPAWIPSFLPEFPEHALRGRERQPPASDQKDAITKNLDPVAVLNAEGEVRLSSMQTVHRVEASAQRPDPDSMQEDGQKGPELASGPVLAPVAQFSSETLMRGASPTLHQHQGSRENGTQLLGEGGGDTTMG